MARETLESLLQELDSLATQRPSSRASSLCGSACRRLAQLHAWAADAKAEQGAVLRMARYYARAEKLGGECAAPNGDHPALSRMAAELVLNAGSLDWPGFDAAATRAIRESLAATARDNPDFWGLVALTELSLYEAVAAGTLAGNLAALNAEYADLHARVSGHGLWQSVRTRVELVLRRIQGRNADEVRAADALLELLSTFAEDSELDAVNQAP